MTMETTPWTPGPWEWRCINGHYAVYPVGGRERVADVYCPLDVDGFLSANGRLIAAAPELAALLDRVTRPAPSSTAELEDFGMALVEARALLARVKGE